MRKLILGIICVICLDLAFIIYPGFERKAETVSPVARAGTQMLSEVSSSGLPNGDEVSEDVALQVVSTRSAAIETEYRRASPKRNLTNWTKAAEENASIRPPFKPVIIEYSRGRWTNASPERDPRASERAKKEAARPEERSFIAAVVPVIRKPYDWVKYLGSKMRRL